MRTAAIADLKARLSSYLKKVKAGQEVLITERGSPIAKLVPLSAGAGREGRRARLAAAGVLSLGRGRLRAAFRTPPKGKAIGADILAALSAERDEGR